MTRQRIDWQSGRKSRRWEALPNVAPVSAAWGVPVDPETIGRIEVILPDDCVAATLLLSDAGPAMVRCVFANGAVFDCYADVTESGALAPDFDEPVNAAIRVRGVGPDGNAGSPPSAGEFPVRDMQVHIDESVFTCRAAAPTHNPDPKPRPSLDVHPASESDRTHRNANSAGSYAVRPPVHGIGE
jgi:hypothetical protein